MWKRLSQEGEGVKIKEKKSEGMRSDVRGKGKKVADSSPTSEMVRMAICGAEPEKVVESSKKIGGSGSGKAAEGLVNLSTHTDEPGSSIEETLADLLKKVGASYNPKKRRTPTPKTPSIAKTTKKRKAASPTITDFSLPKRRATRSKLKQSEEELQKAMEESKKKRMDKGKVKVAELVESVDVDEMDPVHQGKHVTVEVEVQTPKPKKTKTSSKKTRSAVKAKQVKITEEEDWSGEEEDESDNEQDKLAKFGK
ncbi:protein pxr-1-like [Nicotiana sylvestris]|uniref:protein pxr-1-like n=1 Tax=Nicotiana sylvestris TaxID=4096 RepID=UPI00388CBD02